MQFKRLLIIALFSLTPLLIPLIAMQFTRDVNWTPMDFIVAWTLIFCTSMLFSFTITKVRSKSYRIVIGIVLLVSFLLVWAELAVGIFGTPLNGN